MSWVPALPRFPLASLRANPTIPCASIQAARQPRLQDHSVAPASLRVASLLQLPLYCAQLLFQPLCQVIESGSFPIQLTDSQCCSFEKTPTASFQMLRCVVERTPQPLQSQVLLIVTRLCMSILVPTRDRGRRGATPLVVSANEQLQRCHGFLGAAVLLVHTTGTAVLVHVHHELLKGRKLLLRQQHLPREADLSHGPDDQHLDFEEGLEQHAPRLWAFGVREAYGWWLSVGSAENRALRAERVQHLCVFQEPVHVFRRVAISSGQGNALFAWVRDERGEEVVNTHEGPHLLL
mmetsp:Transcript_2480/g.5818  ORF Transcript_2480/g.5818 Transcript_2480/m.5818 type:complete len:293 (+) Transcript_2480:222-1100(+)